MVGAPLDSLMGFIDKNNALEGIVACKEASNWENRE